LKLDAILARQKLYRVAATNIACVNGPLEGQRAALTPVNKDGKRGGIHILLASYMNPVAYSKCFAVGIGSDVTVQFRYLSIVTNAQSSRH